MLRISIGAFLVAPRRLPRDGMSKKKKDEPVDSAELIRKHERWMAVINGVVSCFWTAIVMAGLCVGCYVTFYLPVQVSHGETTTISNIQSWVFDLNAHVVVAWSAGAGGIAYAMYQRRRLVGERAQKDARI